MVALWKCDCLQKDRSWDWSNMDRNLETLISKRVSASVSCYPLKQRPVCIHLPYIRFTSSISINTSPDITVLWSETWISTLKDQTLTWPEPAAQAIPHLFPWCHPGNGSYPSAEVCSSKPDLCPKQVCLRSFTVVSAPMKPFICLVRILGKVAKLE